MAETGSAVSQRDLSGIARIFQAGPFRTRRPSRLGRPVGVESRSSSADGDELHGGKP